VPDAQRGQLAGAKACVGGEAHQQLIAGIDGGGHVLDLPGGQGRPAGGLRPPSAGTADEPVLRVLVLCANDSTWHKAPSLSTSSPKKPATPKRA
jgi:hypothetical protein